MPNCNPKQDGLKLYRDKCKQDTFNSVRSAIETLKKQKKPISINAVSKVAKVSNVTIYKYKELVDEINSHKKDKTVGISKKLKSDNVAQMQVIIEGLEMKVNSLLKENEWLKNRVETQNGEIYELRKKVKGIT